MELNISIKFENDDLTDLAKKENSEILRAALSLLSTLATPQKVKVTSAEPKAEIPVDRKDIEKKIKDIVLEKKLQGPVVKEIVKSYGVEKVSGLTDEDLVAVFEKVKAL